MSDQWDHVLYEKIDQVAKISMNRPEVRNAQNWKMLHELDAAFSQAEKDDDVRVIILAGTGPSFCSGHDLGSPESRAERAAEPPRPGIVNQFWRETEIYLNYCFHWRDIPKATIAQVQGHCIAGGLMTAASCDLIVASEDAKFSDPVLSRLSVGGVEYLHHPWDLGFRKAKELLFTSEILSAQEAWRLGLVSRVVSREKLEEETMQLAKKIAVMEPFALAMTKASLNEAQDIMGFKTSIINHFKYHQLAHAHNSLVALQGGPKVGVGAVSVSDWAKQKDKPLEGAK